MARAARPATGLDHGSAIRIGFCRSRARLRRRARPHGGLCLATVNGRGHCRQAGATRCCAAR
eukprot:5050753-Prymnesium_polylepis.2